MFSRKRRPDGNFFKASAKERRATEDDQPWFLGDDDGPVLEVDAGRSARMDDLDGP